MRKVLLALLVILASTASAFAALIDIGDERRTYVLHTPPGEGPWPLVVVLHGGNDRENRIRRRMGWDDLADAAGFAVVLPKGIENGWNDGRDNAARWGDETPPDDVVFFDVLLDRLIADGIADPERVFVTGRSNGGMMTLRLACDRGIAPLIACLSEALYPVCLPPGPSPSW